MTSNAADPADSTTPLAQVMAHQLAAGHCPGALALVERGGQVLARHTLGLVQPGGSQAMHGGVRFRIASLTKPVVTLAALMLVDEGRLALDAPVGEYLPVLSGVQVAGGAAGGAADGSVDGRQAPRRAPTVRDLMRHSSGLAYPFEIPHAGLRATWLAAGFNPALSGLDSATFLQRLAALPLVAEPGTVFRYGYSTDVLGCIIEQLCAAPLDTVLQQRLFTPLGMAHTGFELGADEGPNLAQALPEDKAWHSAIPTIGRRAAGQPWMPSGGGGLISTLDDYARFARLLAHSGVAQDGPAQGQRLLSEAMAAELARDQLPDGVDGPAAYCGPGFGFGLGLAVRQDSGPAAMACSPGELVWSGISGTAMFVQPRTRWFALLFTANMASRMLARMMFRRAAGPA